MGIFFTSKYSKMQKNLEEILSLKNLLMDIFKIEEEAVVEHNINKIEDVSQKKIGLHQELEEYIRHLNNEVHKITQTKMEDAKTLTELKHDVEKMMESDNVKISFSDQKRLIKSLALFEKVIESFKDIKPKIEKNRYLIETLLRHHQQSYQFWNDVLKERNSQYNSQGAINSQKTISQLCAKA